MPSKALRQWTIPRRDLAAGGSALVQLSHPLLPVFVSARPGAKGLVLGVEGAGPTSLAKLDAPARRAYLVRLGSLTGFLSFHGLGLAPEDISVLGARDGDPERPSLGAPPVAAWRAVSPALAVAAAAVRLAGGDAGGKDPGSLRRAVETALDGPLPRDVKEDVVTALRAADARGRSEGLVSELARRGGVGRAVSRDLLGLALPAAFATIEIGSGPATAVGSASLWLARCAARGDEPPAFVECVAGSALEEGGALRRLACSLGDDPRAAVLRALADGSRHVRPAEGPPFALVAIALERWDGRSRRAFEKDLSGLGFRLFATRDVRLEPWEDAPLLSFRLNPGDAASLLWLPFASVHDAVAAWREAEEAASEAAGTTDAGRVLEAVRDLAARFDPREGCVTSQRARPATSGRRGPVLEAAALLAPGFRVAEAAATAGVAVETAEEALVSAVEDGVLALAPEGGYAYRDDGERRRIASRVPASGRRDAVARLEASGAAGERFAIAALARGNPSDLSAARAALDASAARGDLVVAAEILARASQKCPDFGRPLLAVRILQAAGRPQAAREAANRILSGASHGVSLDDRLATARALVSIREEERALALCPGGAPDEDIARAWVLVNSRHDDAARRVLARAAKHLVEAPVALRFHERLLSAELHERAHDYGAAAAALAEAEALLPGVEEHGLARDLARTAGYLANDLGRTDEAIALFRRAESLSRSGLERADAAYDVAHAALDGGRFDVAARELDAALGLYAAGRHEERYLSALGNRIDLLLKSGDFSAARAILGRVLSHERASGRNHQILFAIPSLQELALLDGDDGEAAAAFREAEERGAADPSHPAWREILLLEAERLLAVPDPEAALALLARAGEIPDNRSRTEGRRLRLLASASRDAGRPLREGLSVRSDERALLDAETALASGRTPSDAASAALEHMASSGAGAGTAVRRVLEWRGRFSSVFATSAAGPLVRLARRLAARAGLARAEQCFTRTLEHGSTAEAHLPPSPSAFSIVAEDPATRDVFEKASRVARSTISVLLLGESGTGKEIVARELHRLSGRHGPFVAVNVAALPATLAEAELFGHARGAFTGADRDRKGLVEESSGGTLFLDEIGDLPFALQGKLLRVLQEAEVRRLGETAVRRVNLRVVSATHRPLKEMAEAAAFRADLYFRLAGLELELPPLRERVADLVRFLDVGLRSRATLTREASCALRAWPWPGNVRELLAALEAAVVLAAPGRVVGLEHLPRALRERSAGTPAARPYRAAVRAARVGAIEDALLETKGNRTRAARHLGISRQSLLYEIKKLKIGKET